MKTFTAYIEYDAESQTYVGVIPGVPGAHSVGDTLDELQSNLKEALELIMEVNPTVLEGAPHFVGLQQIEVGA
jgi:predicted RNase H-like HicB family nuclease